MYKCNIDIGVVCCQHMKLNLSFTLLVHLHPKHVVNTHTHYIFHIGDSRDDNVVVNILVPSVPKKRRVTKEGHVMKPAITHRGKEIAGDPFISEPASDCDGESGDSQHCGADEDEDEKAMESETETDNAEGLGVQEPSKLC